MNKLFWRLKFCALAALTIGYDRYYWHLSETLYTVRNGRVTPAKEVLTEYLNAHY